MLYKLIAEVQRKNPDTQIYLLIDNDDAANSAIEKVLNDIIINKKHIFDCNDMIMRQDNYQVYFVYDRREWQR